MKTLKFILFTLIATTILSCSDNSTEPAFILSNESLAGDYDIAVLNIDIETMKADKVHYNDEAHKLIAKHFIPELLKCPPLNP